MKKALHILKIVLKDTVMPSEKEYVNEAIKELEELQNRSCKNCFYFNSKYQLLDINNSITNRCEKLSLYVTDDFCCNKWESK